VNAGSVTVTWSWAAGGTQGDGCGTPIDANSSSQTFSDQQAYSLGCSVTYPDDGSSPCGGDTTCTGGASFGIDRTAPAVSLTPNAAPSATGWFTHPFQLTVSTSNDGLSPIGCEGAIAVNGPEGNGSKNGTCTDAAGNGTTATFTYKYDDGPPAGVVGNPTRPADHNGWFNHAVSFAFTGTDPTSGIAGCDTVSYDGADSGSATVPGTCTNGAGLVGTGASVAFAYDATPPTITGTPADRSPDHNGWYTHPVTFNFQGSDPTSQISACSHMTYTGPDDGTATLKGSCTDGAGNVTNKTIQFKYDATPPAKGKLYAIPGNKSLGISWAPPSDGDSFQLTRAPANGSAAPTTVYSGSNHDFVDEGLQNGAKYNYLLTVFDAAGNASAASGISGVPDGSSLRPFLDTEIDHPPRLSWRKVRKAGYYNVQLFRGRTKVLSIWPKKPHLRLGTKWKFNGHRYRLTKGLYRWYVWPGLGSPSKHRYGSMVGSSTFRVTK
jgi:hypothetical protein